MIYDLVNHLLEPFTTLFVICAVVLAILWRRLADQRRRLIWLVIPFIALYLFCMPAVSFLTLGSLEWRHPPMHERPTEPIAIIVLSGGIYPPNAVRKKAILDESTMYRCLRAIEVYNSGPPCPVLVTGGKVDADRAGPQLADAMRDFLISQGVAEEDILVERESRSTFENALFGARVLRDHNITSAILVTDAMHLDRSLRCFRAQSIDVTPAGCRYRAAEFTWSLFTFLPSAGAARGNQLALHEWLGLTWYWLKGRI